MKSLKLLLLASVLFLGFNAVSAQTKVAHIDSEALVAAMPETKQMEEALKKIAQSYDTEYKSMTSSLQAKVQKYQAEAPTQTDAENKKRGLEVAELEKKLQVYTQTAQQELAKKQNDLVLPIIEKATKAINEVAKEKGIQYVIDAARGKGLIVKNGEDLLPAVKSKLGLK